MDILNDFPGRKEGFLQVNSVQYQLVREKLLYSFRNHSEHPRYLEPLNCQRRTGVKRICARSVKKFEGIVLVLAITAAFIISMGNPACTLADNGKDSRELLKKITLPQGLDDKETVLTVTGKIGKTPTARFDLKTLERFPKKSFVTYDPWDDQERKYEGLLLSDLLRFLEMDSSATRIEVHARNDYKAVIGVKDADRIGYLLAYRMDDKYFHELGGKLNKGPLSVAIDFNTHKDIDMDVYKQNLVWWIDIITIK